MANGKEEITITITPEGETEVSVAGVKGQGCKALTDALEKALGTVVSDRTTDEFNQREVHHEQRHNRA